jgi:predicted phage terminase large subunit-like protein
MVAVAHDPIMQLSSDEWSRRAARAGFLPFVRRMYTRYETGRHHRLIAEKLEAVESGKIDRLIITMPPRHGKSELASKHFPAWYLGRNPQQRVITCSHTSALAYRFSRQARNIIADSRWPFSSKLAADLASVQSWDLQDGGGYIAAGVNGSITGQGADLLIIDDPVKSAEEADSQTIRDKTWEWYQDTAYPRLQETGAVVVIGTRWHDDDMIGRLLDHQAHGGDQWELLHLPAINDAGEALWPERYSVDRLNRTKANMSSRMWESQFQGNPVPAEGGMFKRHWWKRYTELPAITHAELYLDSAFKEGVANDYSAIALWAADGLGSAFLVRAWRARVDYPGLMRLSHDAYAWSRQRFPGLGIPFVIEDRASGQSAIQSLREAYYTADGVLPALPIVPYAITASASKVSRAEGVTGIVEGGRAAIPENPDWDLESWILEHERFPQGAHDDFVDTTSMGLSRLILNNLTGDLMW